jgi:L,D-transpeptidase catalytic domain
VTKRAFLGLAAVAVMAAGLAACGGRKAAPPPPTPPKSKPARPGHRAIPAHKHARRRVAQPRLSIATLPHGASLVAVATGRLLRVYGRPKGKRPFLVLSDKTEHGEPATFLVKRTEPHWVLISLARRPNGSTGWVRRSGVKLLVNFYRVEVDLTAHKLTLFKHGIAARRIPIGVGKALTPTPTGVYFIVELLRTPDPNGLYGPYAFGLSAYSTVLTQFGAGGKGEIGIHGTNEPDLIGQNVSHGCIRISNQDITRLSKILPLGTPVEITR